MVKSKNVRRPAPRYERALGARMSIETMALGYPLNELKGHGLVHRDIDPGGERANLVSSMRGARTLLRVSAAQAREGRKDAMLDVLAREVVNLQPGCVPVCSMTRAERSQAA